MGVAECSSFTQAAGKMSLSPSALSHRIRGLETELGLRLLARTTRSVALTDAGEQLLMTLKPALGQIESKLAELKHQHQVIAGTIRISSADHAAEKYVWPKVMKIATLHPEIRVELDVENRLIDIVGERFDAGVRLGLHLDKDMISIPIGPRQSEAVVVAPALLAGRHVPLTPQDLDAFQCINRKHSSPDSTCVWTFTSPEGEDVRLRMKGQLSFNRPELIIEAAVAGLGIACVLDSQVEEHIKDGRLIRLLKDWCPEFDGYHIYYPSRRQNSPAFNLLLSEFKSGF